MSHAKDCPCMYCSGRRLGRQIEKAIKKPTPLDPQYSADELKKWWPAKCPKCNWRGLSRDGAGGGAIADTGDYDDPICPECLKKEQRVVLDDDNQPAPAPSEAARPREWFLLKSDIALTAHETQKDAYETRSRYATPIEMIAVREVLPSAVRPEVEAEIPAGPFLEVEIVLGEGGIGVSGGKKKSAPFMDTLSFDCLDAPGEIGAELLLNIPRQSHRVHLRFTKMEAVDVVIGVLQKIKAALPPSPASTTAPTEPK